MSRYIAYKKDGSFDIDKGFIDESCFKEKSDKKIKLAFSEEGFDLEFIDQDKFDELLNGKIDHLKNAKIKKYNESEFLRKYYQFQTINYQDLEFSNSQMARQNMLSISNVNDTPDSKHYWKDITEKAQELTLGDFKEIVRIISARDSKLYYIEAQINAKISLNKDSTAVKKLNIKDLWEYYENNYLKQN